MSRFTIVAAFAGIAAAFLAPCQPAAAAPIGRAPVVKIAVRVALPTAGGLLSPQSHAQYAGRVRTLPGYFPAINTIGFDPDDGSFFVGETSYNNGYATSMYRVSRDGNATLLASFLDFIGGITYDSSTKLVYVTLRVGCSVYAVSPKTGAASLLAGGTCGQANGQGRNAQFQAPAGITADSTGQNLYVADKDRIRTVTPAGQVTTLTAPGSLGSQHGFCEFNSGAQGMTYDPDNASLYVADSCAEVIRQAVVATGNVTTLAGQCVVDPNSGFCFDYNRDGNGANALFGTPASIAFDPLDRLLYVSDTDNNQIRRVDLSGNVTTIAGSGHGEFMDGVGITAGFDGPHAMTSTSKGLLLVADSVNGLVRTVVASGPAPPPPPHGVLLFDPPTLTGQPVGMTATSDGSVWYSEPNVAKMVHVAPNGTQKEYALQGSVVAQLLTSDASGNVWFSDGAGIGRFATTGQLTVYQIPGANTVTDLIAGSDGNIWFVTGGTAFGYVTPSGVIVQYPVDPSNSVCAGYHDDYWTMGQSFGLGVIDDVSSSGATLKRYVFSNSSGSAFVYPLAQGPFRHIWFGQPQALGEIMANTLLMYQLPPAPTFNGVWNVGGIVEGSDHALWFTTQEAGFIGRMTPSGIFTPYEIPAARSAPTTIVRTPSGVLWFVDPGSFKIGRWY